ncbi:MAG: hypothetical protein HRU75_15180 [Planctomycetia bacterium]|nr:MAG: hypothetical protein HRU75_15180 [Planctomycetia bacterium]
MTSVGVILMFVAGLYSVADVRDAVSRRMAALDALTLESTTEFYRAKLEGTAVRWEPSAGATNRYATSLRRPALLITKRSSDGPAADFWYTPEGVVTRVIDGEKFGFGTYYRVVSGISQEGPAMYDPLIQLLDAHVTDSTRPLFNLLQVLEEKTAEVLQSGPDSTTVRVEIDQHPTLRKTLVIDFAADGAVLHMSDTTFIYTGDGKTLSLPITREVSTDKFEIVNGERLGTEYTVIVANQNVQPEPGMVKVRLENVRYDPDLSIENLEIAPHRNYSYIITETTEGTLREHYDANGELVTREFHPRERRLQSGDRPASALRTAAIALTLPLSAAAGIVGLSLAMRRRHVAATHDRK